MPPPLLGAELPDKVEFVTVSVPLRFLMPPPKLAAVLPEMVEFVTVTVPKKL